MEFKRLFDEGCFVAGLTALLFLAGIILLPSYMLAQTPEVAHNTWSSGAAMPTAVWNPAGVGVVKGEIYVVGGLKTDDPNASIADTQIYNPVSNTWSTGVSLPTPTNAGAAMVVKNILYIFGGGLDSGAVTNAVWAFNSKTKTWTAQAAMPTARCCEAAVVEKNIVYVIGGANSSGALATVESYDPETDTWTEEAPLLQAKWSLSAGLLGSTIVAPDGFNGSGDTGDNEGYDATTNSWASLKSDPTPRQAACGGAVGAKMYVASGVNGGTMTESFQLKKGGEWTTLAPIPQATTNSGSAVNKGLLYCVGGTSSFEGTLLNNVQIYQP